MYLMNYPWLGLLLIPVVMIIGLNWLKHQENSYFGKIGIQKIVKNIVNSSEKLTMIKYWLIILAVLFLILGLLRPQWGQRKETLQKRGLDLVFVLDISQSMLAEDIQPNRLDKAVREIKLLLKQLNGDRVGLVTFSGSATPVCPLTLDYGAIEMFLQSIKYYQESTPGTNLTNAYHTAASLFEEKSPQDKIIVIFTDGENNSGDIAGIKADSKAKNIFVIPVAVGSVAGQPIPELDEQGNKQGYKKNKQGKIIISHVDLKGLQSIAALGPYLLDSSNASIGSMLYDFRNFKRSKLKEYRIALYTERFQIFVGIGLILLLVGYSIKDYEDKLRC